MLVVSSFGKNVYIGTRLVGYIGRNVIFISGNKFADLSDNGIISFDKKEIGYIDEDGTIFVHDKEVGYIDENNNFVFSASFLK